MLEDVESGQIEPIPKVSIIAIGITNELHPHFIRFKRRTL